MAGFRNVFKSFKPRSSKNTVVNSPIFLENWGKVLVYVGMYSGLVVPLCHLVWTTIHLPFLYYTAYLSVTLDFDFGLFCSTSFYILMTTSVCISIINNQVNSHHFEALVRQLERGVYRYRGTLDPETEDLIKTEMNSMKRRKKSYSTIMFWLFMMAAVVSMVAFPILFEIPDKYAKKDFIHRELPVVAWYPFSTESWPVYLWLLFTEYWIAFVIIMTVAGTDITFLCYTEEGVSQLKAVGYTLRYVLRRARYVFKNRHGGGNISYKDPRFHDCLKLCLKQSVQHHYQTLEEDMKMPHRLADSYASCLNIMFSFWYFNHMQALYYFILLVIALSSTFMLCLSGILFVSDNIDTKPKLQFFCYLLTLIFHTFTFSWYGEIISNTSLDLGNDIYESEWEACSKVIRSYLLIMEAYVGQPIIMTAGGFMPFNLNTFGSILSSSYSYFNLLSVMMARSKEEK